VMKKLTIKERLDNWAKCEYDLDWECDQCQYYSQFENGESKQFVNSESKVCGDYDGLCELDNRPVYSDSDCANKTCNNCRSNNRCAIQAQTTRYVEDLNLLVTDFDEYNNVLLFQSLLTKKILNLIAQHCPHFERRL